MRLAFVIPWYGPGIPGGAESECRKTALRLKARGFDVEILTTCVRDFQSDWEVNHYAEGAETVEGLTVRRFRARKRDKASFDAINGRLMRTGMERLRALRAISHSASPLSPDEEETYIRESVNSPGLNGHIGANASSYDLFIFIPYMFGTTYYGSLAAGEKAVLIPCLHDESYAYMSIYGGMFRRARGVVYHSASEMTLAERLYGCKDNGVLLGEGVDTAFESDGQRFMERHRIRGPFILYAGRKDESKNTHLLIEYFCRFRGDNPESPLKLVLMGPGPVEIPGKHKKDIIDLGFLPAEDKFDAYGAAMCLCQPSLNESFSLVMMEAWAAGTPALVHAGCDVTRDFCVESGGGLYFSDYPEFAECLLYLFENEGARKALGERGSDFVKGRYSWDSITEKLAAVLRGWNEGDRGTSAPF